jgi:hypothetical protein
VLFRFAGLNVCNVGPSTCVHRSVCRATVLGHACAGASIVLPSVSCVHNSLPVRFDAHSLPGLSVSAGWVVTNGLRVLNGRIISKTSSHVNFRNTSGKVTLTFNVSGLISTSLCFVFARYARKNANVSQVKMGNMSFIRTVKFGRPEDPVFLTRSTPVARRFCALR